MIKKVHLQNFKCLQDTQVDLGPFTLLIGQNDSGKTSFLEAIHLLGRTAKEPLHAIFGGAQLPFGGGQLADLQSLVWQRRQDRNIVWNVSGEAGEAFEYRLELKPSGGHLVESLRIGNEVIFEDVKPGSGLQYREWHIGVSPEQTVLCHLAQNERHHHGPQAPVAAVADALGSTEEYHLNPEAMRSAAGALREARLTSTGDNLAAVLNELLTGPDRSMVNELERQLREAIPTLKGVSTPAAVAGNGAQRCLEFTLAGERKPPVTIPAAQASDGAILLTAFLALAYGNTPQILLVEEPENGLHPSRLKLVIDILRKISTGQVGNQARQVILTTHSPLLLNLVQPDEVRIFRRDEMGATQVVPMDRLPNIERLQREFAPGELWYLFGEEELLTGPTA